LYRIIGAFSLSLCLCLLLIGKFVEFLLQVRLQFGHVGKAAIAFPARKIVLEQRLILALLELRNL